MNFFGTRKVGEIISRFNDAGQVRDAISGATLTIMIDTIMAISYTLGYLSIATCWCSPVSLAFGIAGTLYTCT